METLLSIILGLAMFATVAVLATGVISFAVHGDFYLRNANKLMRWRVIIQGIAVAIFAFILLLKFYDLI
ncbi:MAG: twin transmembrane helix small protein [Rhodospirillales bacterium]|nr:twin transmembrane helix small protein [Rhodospirillales bacterium]